MIVKITSYPSPTLLQLVLELCRGDGAANLQTIQSHLDKIHACSAELSSADQMVKIQSCSMSKTWSKHMKVEIVLRNVKLKHFSSSFLSTS